MNIFFVAIIAVPCALAVRCYDYLSTNDNIKHMKSWVDCPTESRFCFKSYIEHHDINNEKTWLASRSCGTPNLCMREGCWGTRNDKTCCCHEELCNSCLPKPILALLISFVLYFLAVF